MRFIDLSAQYQKIAKEIDTGIAQVLQHGQYIMGPESAALEQRLADYVGVKHAILVSSGTTALQIALMALGIGAGDEVITTPFSFFGTVEAILLVGAVPVFVDIEAKTYNLDVEQLAGAITAKTKAIMPVSLYGQCAEMDAINAIAAQHGLAVIEDAAQSFGATYHGRQSCSLSTIGCTSFFPSKPLGCYGDGGACFTNDDALALAMRRILNHGQEVRYHHVCLGVNGRFDTLQAAILLAKLSVFDEEIAQRQHVAQWYARALDPALCPPSIAPHQKSVFAQYTIQVEQRDEVIAHLQAQGIPTAVHYPALLNEQPVLGEDYHRLVFPVAKQMAERVLSLPFHPYMQAAEVQRVAEAVNTCVAVTC